MSSPNKQVENLLTLIPLLLQEKEDITNELQQMYLHLYQLTGKSYAEHINLPGKDANS